MLRPEISAGAPRRFATAFKLALVAACLFLTGGPAVIAQFDDGNASFWMQERARTQRQRAQTVVQRPTHLIRRAAPRKGFTVEVPAATPGEVDPNAPLGPDGLPVAATPDGATPQSAQAPATPVVPKPIGPTFYVAVIGDNIGQLLAQGLQEAFADQKDIQVLRKARENTGLVRDDYFDWLKGARDLLAGPEKIGVAVMMIGSNDRQSIREGQTSNDPRSARWKQIYASRIEAIAALFKEKKVPLVWVGLPVMKNERLSADLIDFNEIYRDAAGKAGASYVDIWEAFTDDRGQFSIYGPDVNGQIARLRTGDGVHFTKQGARKLAHFAEGDIRSAYDDAHPQETAIAALEQAPSDAQPDRTPGQTSEPSPTATPDLRIALPVPPPTPTPMIPVRPAAGPVVLLTSPATSRGGVLATKSRSTPANDLQRFVDRVLVNGAAPDPRPGRADDFAWPRL